MNHTAPPHVDPNSGYNPNTKTFHSLRPPLALPQKDTLLTAAHYSLSLLSKSKLPFHDLTALIDSSNGERVSYSEFTKRVHALSGYLRDVIKLSTNDTAFVLSPSSIHVPVLYFSLVSLGVVVSPANPVSTKTEISRLVELCDPVIAFATSATAHKLPKFRHRTIFIDSAEFISMMTWQGSTKMCPDEVGVGQSDVAAVMFSSGTTGKVKGVMLTHRNFMAAVASIFSVNQVEERESQVVMLYTVPFFHVYGFYCIFKSIAMKEAMVVTERFEFGNMLRVVEEFRVTNMATAPPVVVSMAKNDLTDGYDLRSLQWITCGGAPLGKHVVAAFTDKFPSTVLAQAYGLTESTGGIFRSSSVEECLHLGAAGRLISSCEAKIVNPNTGNPLSPGEQGELWLRGATIMKGYIGDPAATAAILTSDGWLGTGDLCYIDNEGFLFVVDRLKELIKYKGYQVAPAELEHLLHSHPDIVDAAVAGYPDEEAGQVPGAFVVRRTQSSLNETDIIAYISKQVAPYKKIRRVTFVNSIPKSRAGKILRKDLRQMVLQALSSKM